MVAGRRRVYRFPAVCRLLVGEFTPRFLNVDKLPRANLGSLREVEANPLL